MDVRTRDRVARWRRHPLHVALLVALAASSCSLIPGSPPAGFEQRTAGAYAVLVPVDWETLEDSDRGFQAADPTVDEPMTVRVAVAPEPVSDVEATAEQLHASPRSARAAAWSTSVAARSPVRPEPCS